MKTVTKQELADIILRFLNEFAVYHDFKDFIEEQGYVLEELGIPDED